MINVINAFNVFFNMNKTPSKLLTIIPILVSETITINLQLYLIAEHISFNDGITAPKK